MIVPPAPTNPRSPARRGLRTAGMALPLVLLVGIVAAGSLGPKAEPAGVQDGSSPRAGASAGASAATGPATFAPEPAFDRPPVDFPAAYLGMPVLPVGTALAPDTRDELTGTVALSGYLSLGEVPWTCFDAYLETDPACSGRTVLTDVPVNPYAGTDGSRFAGIGPHLHPRFAPGTRVPAPSADPADPRAEPLPVVVLGSFHDPGLDPCVPERRDCHNAFLVSRVAWAAGEPWDVTLTIDPAMRVEPNIPEIRASLREAIARLGGSPVLLTTAVVRPDLLGTIDPAAARALPPIPPERRLRPVTYVRGLFQDLDPSRPLGRQPAVGWIVLDSISGQLLARGAAADTAPTVVVP